MNILAKIFSTQNEREIKRITEYIKKINQWETKVSSLIDSDFPKKTGELKERIKNGEKPGSILPEAFALVREASKRTLGMRHFDVQLIGGVVLYEGKITEMKTGEGKTLVATLTAYLRALEEKGVHIITVNDHLAKRDATWMGPIYEFLGVSVGYVVHGLTHEEKKEAYAKDITYGTNNEFGFDYLRDNMVIKLEDRVQRSHYFCIVDEVDSVLIDEARTPLIISGPSESDTGKYYKINKVIPRLTEGKVDEEGKEIPGTGDYIIEIKDNNAYITEDGIKNLEEFLNVGNLYDSENALILHHVNQALKAHKLFKRDVDYMIDNGQVVIIDEFTGRKMEGRRFSDGLHQAIEAKENVNILSENQTIATITLQNYFRMYDILAGMTGTADTEAEEFRKIYNLDVLVIPTHMPVSRQDMGDKIYRTEREKFNAIVNYVREAHREGQPVLIGTASVEKSEELSKLLNKSGLRHELLNAKNHEREAKIVSHAGEIGAITIATNMAGRGTDIKLADGVKEKGGLLVIGSERHDSRRIDNQLRGRSGRQGDPGKSIFFISLEDELMRRFQSERISGWMQKLGMKEGEEIEHPLISKQIEMAQKKVEGRNFDIRKYLLEYDDVMNVQRSYIYNERNTFLQQDDIKPKIHEFIAEILPEQLSLFNEGKENVSDDFLEHLHHWVSSVFQLTPPEAWQKMSYNALKEDLLNKLKIAYDDKRKHHPTEVVNQIDRFIILSTLDQKWKEHLLNMDHLRDGINLRAYGEKKPLLEFKSEGFKMFKEMILSFRNDSLERIFRVKIQAEAPTMRREVLPEGREERKDIFKNNSQVQTSNPNQVINRNKIGRNDPCPCGSGKKYKNCHLKQEA